MKISIITATYNRGKTIGDALQSVSTQSYADIEHIVIDGQSTDNTCHIVERFSHVSKFISEPDSGIYDALNKGLRMASGDVIGVLHSDDFYSDGNVINEVVLKFKDENLEALYADLEYVNPENTDQVIRRWKSGEFNPSKFINGWMPPHPTFFAKRVLFEKYGNYSTELKTAADYELMLRFLYKNRINCGYLPRTIIKMRAGGVSNKSIWNRIKGNSQDRTAWKMNNLKPKFYTLYFKPLRKLTQYL